MEYRFSAEFRDFKTGKCFDITQPATQNKDASFFEWWLQGLKDKRPELAQYIVDTAQLIVGAEKKLNETKT